MARARIAPKAKTQPIKREYVMNPAKGLNSLVSESLIDKREASALMNVIFEESGVIEKRDGFRSLPSSAIAEVKGLSYHYTESGKTLLAVTHDVLRKYQNGDWSAPIGAITVGTTRSYIDSTMAAGNTYFWDGSNGGAVYDGTTFTRPGTIPKAKFSIYYNGIHIASGVPGQPSRVYIAAGGKPSIFTRDATGKPSGTATGDGWPDNATDVPGATVFTGTAPAQTIDINKNDGFAVTGLAVFQGKIVIFKENSTWELTFGDNSSVTVSPITKSVGCISHRTICYVENDVYFLSRRGVFVLGNEENFYTAIRTNELSARIREEIKLIKPAGFELCNAIYDRDRYILNVPVNGTTVNRALVYDRRYQAWSVWDNLVATSMINFVDDDNEEHLYFAKPGAEQVKEMIPGLYNDDGTPINAYWESGALDASAIDITKRWVDLGIVLRQLNGTLSVDVYLDRNELFDTFTLTVEGFGRGYGSSMMGEAWIGGSDANDLADSLAFESEPWRLVIKRNSRTIKFRISNDRLDESFGILGYILGYYPFGYYKFRSDRKMY